MKDIAPHPGNGALTIYLALAFGVTWICWIPGLILGFRNDYIMPNFDTYHLLYDTGFVNTEHRLLSALFFLGVFGPLLGGYVATRVSGGRAAVSVWWQKTVRWKIAPSWYLIALALLLSIVAVPVLVFGFIGGFTPGEFTWAFIALILLVQVFRSGLGEEPGWRGYLMPELKRRFAGERYVWVLGAVWSVWHFPIVIVRTLAMVQDLSMWQILVTLVMALAGNIMSLIGITYLYVWLCNRTDSIFLVILFHAFSNVLIFWLLSFLVMSQTAGLAVAVMPWLLVLLLQRLLGKQHFPG